MILGLRLLFLECLAFQCFCCDGRAGYWCCQVVLVSLGYALSLSSCHLVVSDMFLPFPCTWSVSLDLHWSRWWMVRALFCFPKPLVGNRGPNTGFLVPGSGRAGSRFPCTLSRVLSVPCLLVSPSHQALTFGNCWFRC